MSESFVSFIASLGYEPPARIEPGRWTPFSANGKRGNTAGRARLFPDGEGGVVFDWRSGECHTWQAKRERPRTDAELRAWGDKIERAKRDAQGERELAAKETAERAARIWREAKPAEDSHAYLAAKGVRSHGLRLYRGALALSSMKCDGALIVPARDGAGEVVSLAFIAPSGEKRYLSGPRSPGSYFAIGKPEGTLCIAEGYATGASIHEATGHAVAVAFDAGNLEPVAGALRAKFPGLRLIVCADDDAGTAGNPGMAKANVAARAADGVIAVPDFGELRPGGATDFNDVARHRGAEAVQRCLERARAPDMPEDQTQAIGAPAADSTATEGVEIIRADQVKPESVDWLWNGYLAAGKVHIMAGAPGTGKTTLALGLLAALTSAGRWPDGGRAPGGAALIWSGEDSVADTLVPRLIAAGADLRRVAFVGDRRTQDGMRPFDPAEDFGTLEAEAARIPGLRLVVVDPIVSAIAGDSHKSADVRRGLQPLVRFAERTGCAVLGISHFSKGTAGKDPVERVTGSVAFGALARVVLATAKVPDEDGGGRILVRAKSNLGPDGGGFRYELRLVQLEAPHADISATRPEWIGPLEGEARELLAAAELQPDTEHRTATAEALEWLRSQLLVGPMKAGDAQREARQAGISDKALRTARERLGVSPQKRQFEGGWWWQLPAVEDAQVAQDAQVAKLKNMGAFGVGGHLGAEKGASGTAASDVETF